MTDCLFCKIVAKEIPARVLYEDASVLAFLDIGPVSRGHFLLVPKAHATDLNSGSEEDAVALMRAAYQLAPGVLKALGAVGYNLGMNHGVDAGQEVFHTHLHFMPRYAGEPRTFVKTHPSADVLAEIAQVIREHL